MKNRRAFSLIELLITLVIIGILTSLSYPSYVHHILRVHRAAAKAALLAASSRLEEYDLAHHTYEGATLENLGLSDALENGRYVLKLENLGEETYVVAAMPQGAQAEDACGVLSVDQQGNRLPGGEGCW